MNSRLLPIIAASFLAQLLLNAFTARGDDTVLRTGYRTWFEKTGVFSVEAQIVGVTKTASGPLIQLQTKQGKSVEVPYSYLSDADQKFSVEWFKQSQTAPQSLTIKLPAIDDNVKVLWGSSWFKGRIVAIEESKFKFRYDGYDAAWDEWKKAEELRWDDDRPVVPGGLADPVVAKIPPKQPPMPSTEVTGGMPEPAPSNVPAIVIDTTPKETTSTFPKGLSAQETLQYLRAQSEQGNLMEFWEWLPDNVRSHFTSQQHRDNLALLDRLKVEDEVGFDKVLASANQVLDAQETFLLGSELLQSWVSPQNRESIKLAYKPARSLFAEATEWFGSIATEIRRPDFEQSLRKRSARVGPLLKKLFATIGPEASEEFWSRFTVKEDGPNSGSLTIESLSGEKVVYLLTKIDGRWIPRDLAGTAQKLIDSQKSKVAEIKKLSAGEIGALAFVARLEQGMETGFRLGCIEKLDALAQCKTQAEFDTTVKELQGTIQRWLRLR